MKRKKIKFNKKRDIKLFKYLRRQKFTQKMVKIIADKTVRSKRRHRVKKNKSTRAPSGFGNRQKPNTPKGVTKNPASFRKTSKTAKGFVMLTLIRVTSGSSGKFRFNKIFFLFFKFIKSKKVPSKLRPSQPIKVQNFFITQIIKNCAFFFEVIGSKTGSKLILAQSRSSRLKNVKL